MKSLHPHRSSASRLAGLLLFSETKYNTNCMSLLQAIALGLVQGLTEFLPVSSSGHLIFVPKLFGWADQGLAFDVLVHLGTLLAVVLYLRKKIHHLFVALFSTKHNPEHDKRLILLMVIATIPAAVAGFFFGSWIEGHVRSPLLIAINLIVWGIVLWLAELYSRAKQAMGKERHLGTLSWWHAVGIGIAQVISFLPGTSRSGITITAGMFSRLDKRTATEFSFLMSVPVIALAGAAGLAGILNSTTAALPFDIMIAGFLSALFGGLVALWALVRIIHRWSFLPFAVYRIIIGILILLILV